MKQKRTVTSDVNTEVNEMQVSAIMLNTNEKGSYGAGELIRSWDLQNLTPSQVSICSTSYSFLSYRKGMDGALLLRAWNNTYFFLICCFSIYSA